MARRPVGPGPASYRLLGWVARLGITGIEPARLALGMSQPVVYSHASRLVAAGLLWRVRVGDGGGGVLALTRAGARVARDRRERAVVSPRSSAPSSARHGRAVSWVAAALELRGWEWLGPAELRAQSGWRVQRDDGARHAPDLGMVRDGSPTAIEVELHPKAPRRLAAILGGYRGLIDRGSLTAVSYVVDRRDVGELVRREGERALLGRDLQIGPLEPLIKDARSRAAAGSRDRRLLAGTSERVDEQLTLRAGGGT